MSNCIISPFEALFWMASTFILLFVSYEMYKKYSDLQVDLHVQKRLVQYATEAIIDMGYQLFNLTVLNPGQSGYVYVLKSDSGHYKIGKTTDPKNRRETFGIKLPMEVEYIVLIQSSNHHRLEATLHEQFKHKRINGEWFNLSHNDLIWFNGFPGNILRDEEKS